MSALLMASAFLSSPAQAQALSCGAVVTTDVLLTQDLVGCTGDGLVVGADGITVDLGGHTISGTRGRRTAGIRLDGVDRVHVQGGTIASFDLGIYVNASTNVTVDTMVVQSQRTDGVQVFNSQRFLLRDSDVTSSGRSGVVLQQSIAAVARTNATNNRAEGFYSLGGRVFYLADVASGNAYGFNVQPYPGVAGATAWFRDSAAVDNLDYGYHFAAVTVTDAGGNSAANNGTACGPGICPLTL
ncbi:MAG: right-handed parallel beta-helix repeat-containing protein [Alphaproteobacteria bacterium]|nr:right-handed parallel beta-helix repeat-containing protein [Alphaproteobacteria bacterium]MCB9695894.1 right-handed parallel beta-helix repeat-containing protein [Alphaproteobacteria bacterium]